MILQKEDNLYYFVIKLKLCSTLRLLLNLRYPRKQISLEKKKNKHRPFI